MTSRQSFKSFLKTFGSLGVAFLIVAMASCTSKKDQGTTAGSTGESGDSVAKDQSGKGKLFIQDTPEAKYADSLYARFLRDNPTYFKENPMKGAFLRTEVVSNQLVDLESSPGVRVLQAVCIFNKGDVTAQGGAEGEGLYARLLILEVKDRTVAPLASRDIDIPNTSRRQGTKNSLNFVNLRVTPNNDAIGMVSEYQRHADGLDQQKRELTLFIIREGDLTEVLKTTLRDSRTSYGPGADYNPNNDQSMEVELKVFGASTMGLFDLLESTESKGARRATSNSVKTLRWNGVVYE